MDSQKSLPQKKGQKFELKKQNKLKIDPRYFAHYMLSWITYVDNYCNFHHVLKAKHNKYPRKTEQNNSKKKF